MRALMETKTVTKAPLTEVLKSSKGIVALGIGACVIGVSATYFKGTFALAWAVDEGLFSRTSFLSIVTISLVVQFIVQPFGAVIASKLTLRKAVLLMLVPELLVLPLMFMLIGTGDYTLAVIGMAVATIPHSMYYAAMAGILAKSFPPNIRYTGISLSYQLSSTVFAGTAPMMGQYLLNATGSILAVIVLAVVHVAITIASVLGLLSRSRSLGADYGSADSFGTESERTPATGIESDRTPSLQR